MGGEDMMEIRMRRLEDCEEIRNLLSDYGRTLDQRDFGAFAGLFAEDAEYIVGGGAAVARGAAAIGNLLEDIFRKNPTGLGSPNFHVFANETIQVEGNTAVATSKGLFVVPGENNKPEIAMMATYSDVLIRENGRWKFKRRAVHGDLPAPQAAK
jgi:uncharacterized protein (TIGR02246 family)